MQRAARAAFRRSGASALREAVRVARQQYTAGAHSAIPGAGKLAAAFQQGGVRGFMRLAGGTGWTRTWDAIERYARDDSVGKRLVGEFLRELGPIGNILGWMVGHNTGKAGLGSDLKSAIEFINAFGDEPAVLSALERILKGRGAEVVMPAGMTRASRGGTSPTDIARQIAAAVDQAASGSSGRQASGSGGSGGGRGGRGGAAAGGDDPGGGGSSDGRVEVNVDGQMEKLPPGHPLVTGEMIETPQSSNVYAFGFHNDTHSLFVRFKDHRPAAAGGYRIKSVFSGGSGGEGLPNRGRPHRPGPLYLYHNVPARLFLAFIDASSKGDWVWDNLRIRGTLSGHQYDYALVGVQGAYVPRKATLTPAGEEFLPRSIFTDKGRSLSSPLPQELIRPLIPLRSLGRPPNDGRGGLGGRRR